MGRAELRRVAKKKVKNPTYTLTKTELDAIVREKVRHEFAKTEEEATDEAINTAMLLMLTLPLEVLLNHYSNDISVEDLQRFTGHVLDYYKMWQDGELDMNKMRDDLWEYGGVRLEKTEE